MCSPHDAFQCRCVVHACSAVCIVEISALHIQQLAQVDVLKIPITFIMSFSSHLAQEPLIIPSFEIHFEPLVGQINGRKGLDFYFAVAVLAY